MAKVEEQEALAVEVTLKYTKYCSFICAVELGHFKPLSFCMELRTFLYSRLSVFLLWSITHEELRGGTKPEKK